MKKQNDLMKLTEKIRKLPEKNKLSSYNIGNRVKIESIQRGPFLKHLFPRHGLPGKFDLLVKSLKILIPRNEDLFLLKNRKLNLKLSFPVFTRKFDLFPEISELKF